VLADRKEARNLLLNIAANRYKQAEEKRQRHDDNEIFAA
jgi:hypothetical protein